MNIDKSLSSRLLDVFVHGFIVIVLIATLLPVVHVISVSLSGSSEIMAGNVSIFPRSFSLSAYRLLVNDKLIPGSFLNSIVITIIGTIINMILTISVAYPLSKKKLPYRNFFMGLIIVTMFFGGGLIPSFLLVTSLGMYNSYWALILPGAISTYNMIIMRTFFGYVPDDIEEAARIDGAGMMQTLFRIILPLSMAAIATISLFYAVGHWNSWFSAMIYLYDVDKFPLQLVIRELIMQNETARLMAMAGDFDRANEMSGQKISVDGLKYSALVLSIIPMLIIYPFVQKYFVKGVMVGSLKG